MRLVLPLQVERLAADQAVTNSVALVTMTNFSLPIAANQIVLFTWRCIFTLGATGGFRFQVTGPAGIGAYNAQYHIVDLTTPTRFDDDLSAQGPFTNASAVASGYTMECFGSVENGATAGNITFQFAQNNATANPITILEGASVECVLF